MQFSSPFVRCRSFSNWNFVLAKEYKSNLYSEFVPTNSHVKPHSFSFLFYQSSNNSFDAIRFTNSLIKQTWCNKRSILFISWTTKAAISSKESNTSNISSLDTSMRQWPACGCWRESSCLRTFNFCTKSLSYLCAGNSSPSSSDPSFGAGRGCWLGSFSWHWWLWKKSKIFILEA